MADEKEKNRAPKWAWWLLGIVSLITTISVSLAIKSPEKKDANVPYPRAAVERTVIITIKPGEEVSYQVPPKHWFRIFSEENVAATTWDGRKIKDIAWLGDEIRDANFRLKSNEKEKDAKVVITLRQK